MSIPPVSAEMADAKKWRSNSIPKGVFSGTSFRDSTTPSASARVLTSCKHNNLLKMTYSRQITSKSVTRA